MEPRTLEFFAQAGRGACAGVAPGVVATRVVTDSREVRAGDLFVALIGDRFDGHDYAAEAVARGAVAVVVARGEMSRVSGLPAVVVDDTRVALVRMAAAYRREFSVPMVAIAGSNGKTTTKELLGTTLGSCFETLRNRESFNNDIGVPITLLELEDRHLAAVVEVGTNHPGELAPLLRLVQPRVGVLTQIGEEHLEFFGSVAGVIEEEGWLAEMLPPDGLLILPGDPEWSAAIGQRTRATVVRVGQGLKNDWRLLEAEFDREGATFSVRAPAAEWSGEYRVNLLGVHQVQNALLAVAAASHFGLTREEIQRGLASCRPAKWRMNRWSWEGVEVIEDCYNANLDSTLAAIETLRRHPCPGRRVLVLGEMAELGGHAGRAHAAVGRAAAEAGLQRLVAVGSVASASALAAAQAGEIGVNSVETLAAAEEDLRGYLRPGDCVLIKGSRAARLERLGAMLRDDPCLQRAA